jgi:hypothetical protein
MLLINDEHSLTERKAFTYPAFPHKSRPEAQSSWNRLHLRGSNAHWKTIEASMRQSLLALVSAATLGVLATTSANAMPVAPRAPTVPGIDRVHLVCNQWGQCWRRPDHYRPYRPYGYYGYGYEKPRYRYDQYDYYGPRYYDGHGYGWHRHWHDDD